MKGRGRNVYSMNWDTKVVIQILICVCVKVY